MIDQATPPFAVGDVAYTRSSPGGYASAAAVPTDPAFGGADQAYAVPSLGGEFQPGSGKASPTDSPISKGADADGGAADIAAAPRLDTPAAPEEPDPVPLAIGGTSPQFAFSGTPEEGEQVLVTYQVNGDEEDIAFSIPLVVGESAGAVAARVAAAIAARTELAANSSSNAVTVTAKSGHVLDTITMTVGEPL